MCVILTLQNAGGVKYLLSGVNMRLSKEQVEKISKIILDNLKTKGLYLSHLWNTAYHYWSDRACIPGDYI